jgi:hypothetical protein
MSKAEVAVEMKVHEMESALDDLTSLAQNPFACDALRKSNLEGIERRLRHLRFDLMALALQAAE